MYEQTTDPAAEVKRLQRCMNDLVSVLALPAIWSDHEPGQILDTFLDALVEMLDLDFLYGTIKLDSGSAPVEALSVAQSGAGSYSADGILQALHEWFGKDPQPWPGETRRQLGNEEISICPLPLGIAGNPGFLVAGTRRAGFPEQTERLILSVAANQAAIGLQQALHLSEHKRVASELDRRVAERTRELEEINGELQLQVSLLQNLPVSAWTLKPDGTPDFVNQVWLEFSGQTLDYVRSHPEAWMTAVHPDDRERAAKVFWDGVRLGQGFAVETRSLRARDGSWRWHLQQAVVLRDAEGKVLRFVGTTTDIDDQKRAEEKLRASERNLLRVIDTIPTLSWCNLADGANEFLSKSWHEYTGLSPEEAHGWGWSAAFHPDDLPPLMKRWQEMLVSGEPGEIEARLRRIDGVYRWFLIRAAPFSDDTGAIVRWYGTSTDIDDRKRAEEALRASEKNARDILDGIPGLVCAMDATGEIQQLNRPLLEYYGKTIEGMKSWATNDSIHPDDRSRVVAMVGNAIRAGTPHEFELRCRRADGVYRWFQVSALPVRDSEGRITRWYFLMTDIEDRKRAEEELKRSEARYRVVVETASDVVISINESGAIILANPATERIFGHHPEALIGRPLTMLMPKARRALHLEGYQRYLDTGVRHLNWQGTEVTALRADGEEFPAEVSFGEMTADGRKVFTGFIRDISEKKRAEEALSKARTELAHFSRVTSLAAFTASIAHEINQPLSGIVTNASTCLRMLDAVPANVDGARETARRALRDGNRASDVIARLRALFTRKEVKTEPVDINEVAREVIALYLSELERNRVTIRQEFAEGLPSIMGDRIQLQQVILNLLRNASDAMSAVDDRPRELLLSTEPAGEEVHFIVRDTGTGIDPAAAERLFESFYTTKEGGMGIGLSVSRSIIEAHDGRLWVMANDGPGATFTFSVPCT